MTEKRYWESDRKFCRLSYTHAEQGPLTVWAEVGQVHDVVQWFFEVNERTQRLSTIYVQLGEFSMEPAMYNLETKTLEVV